MIMNARRLVLPLFLIMGVTNGMPLLGGRYETTTDVQGILNLALDVAAMQQSNDENERKSIYENVSFLGFQYFDVKPLVVADLIDIIRRVKTGTS
jgi:hypothetical protein